MVLFLLLYLNFKCVLLLNYTRARWIPKVLRGSKDDSASSRPPTNNNNKTNQTSDLATPKKTAAELQAIASSGLPHVENGTGKVVERGG